MAQTNWTDRGTNPEVAHVNTIYAADLNALGAEINGLLTDAPRFLKFSTTWPARVNDNRLTFFVGGVSPTNAPTDANLHNNDVWLPSSPVGLIYIRTGGAWVLTGP